MRFSKLIATLLVLCLGMAVSPDETRAQDTTKEGLNLKVDMYLKSPERDSNTCVRIHFNDPILDGDTEDDDPALGKHYLCTQNASDTIAFRSSNNVDLNQWDCAALYDTRWNIPNEVCLAKKTGRSLLLLDNGAYQTVSAARRILECVKLVIPGLENQDSGADVTDPVSYMEITLPDWYAKHLCLVSPSAISTDEATTASSGTTAQANLLRANAQANAVISSAETIDQSNRKAAQAYNEKLIIKAAAEKAKQAAAEKAEADSLRKKLADQKAKEKAEKAQLDTQHATALETIGQLKWLGNANNPSAPCGGTTPGVHIYDPDEPFRVGGIDILGDNYLCGKATETMVWSANGRIADMKCSRLALPGSPVWYDNYLCVPYDFPYDMRFSTLGEITTLKKGGECINISETGFTPMANSFLCWEPNEKFEPDHRKSVADLVAGRMVTTTTTKHLDGEDFEVETKVAVKVPSDKPVTLWTKQEIKNYLQVLSHKEMLSFVDGLSKTERHAVTPHMNKTQRDAYLDWREMTLSWSIDGPIPGQNCTKIVESQFGWDNVFLCAKRDRGFRWSDVGRLPGMKCTSFYEGVVDGKNSDLWKDNFLCAPADFEYDMLFVSGGSIGGMQDKCVNLKVNPLYADPAKGIIIPPGFTDPITGAWLTYSTTVNASWDDNWLCYDRDRLISYDGHWEQATPPCPTCPEIDYAVTYGVEKGEEKSSESSFGIEVSMSFTEQEGVEGVASATEEFSTTFSASYSSAVSDSFTQSKGEEITVPCGFGAVWQWVANVERECSFGSACPSLTARSKIFQCTVPGDEPTEDPNWSPCEPIFVDNLTATPARRLNSGNRSDLPGGWRCRNDGEILIDQATYGRNCNAPSGNVTDVVAFACQGTDTGVCEFNVDPARLGDLGRPDCKPNFEVQYNCAGDGDTSRGIFAPFKDGHTSKVTMSCPESSDTPVVYAALPKVDKPVTAQPSEQKTKPHIAIHQATYGRNCGAPTGNVTDLVAVNCQDKTSSCQYTVDLDRLGDVGRPECRRNFEVFFTCPGDNDVLRSAYVPGEAGYKTSVPLTCGDDISPITVTAEPDPDPGVDDSSLGLDEKAKEKAPLAPVAQTAPVAPSEVTISTLTINTPELSIKVPSLSVQTPQVTVSADKQTTTGPRPQPAHLPDTPYCVVPMPQQKQCSTQSPQTARPQLLPEREPVKPQAAQPYGQSYEQPTSPNAQPYDQPTGPEYPQPYDQQPSVPGFQQPYEQGYQDTDPNYPQPYNQQPSAPGFQQPYEQGYQDADPNYPQPYDQQPSVPGFQQPYEQGYQDGDPNYPQPYDQQPSAPGFQQPYEQGYQDADPNYPQPYDQQQTDPDFQHSLDLGYQDAEPNYQDPDQQPFDPANGSLDNLPYTSDGQPYQPDFNNPPAAPLE